MKKTRSSLKSVRGKITAYILITMLGLLAFLWVFETFFLNSFYEHMKIDTVKKVSSNVVLNYGNDGFDEYINEVARPNDLCIMYIVNDDSNFQLGTNYQSLLGCKVTSLTSTQVANLIYLAEQNGGSYLYELDNSVSKFNLNPFIDSSQVLRDESKDLIQITVVNSVEDESSLVVLVNARVTPISTTISTLKAQLIVYSAIVILITLILSWVLSKKIAQPIMEINNDAKNLAKGNYSTHLHGKTYAEIEQLNDSLNKANEEINKTEKYKREILSNVSHDLRTPLTMISGYGEMMRDIPGENNAENIQVIIDESHRLTSLVNDVLSLSKLENNTMVLEASVINMTGLIKQTIDRYNRMVELNGYTLNFEHDQIVYCNVDQSKILQVLYNLINNAVNYTGEDKTVTIRQMVKGDKVRIEVSDTGEGIAPEELDSIWERYYKSKKSHLRATVGSGIGLSIVKAICELHHAQYGVESTLNVGSTFWFELKIDHIGQNEDDSEEDTQSVMD